MSDQPAMHSPEAHDAITAELVACTLGQRQRPELRTDLVGKLHHAMAQIRAGLARAGFTTA